jgi:hypothetical protein
MREITLTKWSAATAALVLMLNVLPAQATPIIQTVDFGPSSLGAAMASATFNQFDPSFGTLDQVIITLDARISGDTSITRVCSGICLPATPSGSTTRTVTLDLSSAGLTDLNVNSGNTWNTLFGAGSGTTTHTQSVIVTGSPSVIDSASLAFFTGLGTYLFDLNGSVTDNISFSGAGTWSVSQLTGIGNGSVTVE